MQGRIFFYRACVRPLKLPTFVITKFFLCQTDFSIANFCNNKIFLVSNRFFSYFQRYKKAYSCILLICKNRRKTYLFCLARQTLKGARGKPPHRAKKIKQNANQPPSSIGLPLSVSAGNQSPADVKTTSVHYRYAHYFAYTIPDTP